MGFLEVARGVFVTVLSLVNPEARRKAKKKTPEQEQKKQRII